MLHYGSVQLQEYVVTGLWSADVRLYLYADGNTDDENFLANSTRGLNNHVWWAKVEG